MSQERFDFARTLRFAVVGLTCHGPYFGLGFARIDAYFGQTKGLGMVLKKVAATQVFLNPPYLVLLFGWMGMLEGRRWDNGELIENTKEKTMAAMLPNFAFWPVANFINFSYVSPAWRVACEWLQILLIHLSHALPAVSDVASCGGMWNTYISLLNKSQDQEKAAAAAAVPPGRSR